MRLHRFDHIPRPMAWLPNREHNFMGVKHDGSQVVCSVARDGAGKYHVVGAQFSELKGWFPMPMVRGGHS